MVDKKLTELTETTTTSGQDQLYLVQFNGTTYDSKRITRQNFLAGVGSASVWETGVFNHSLMVGFSGNPMFGDAPGKWQIALRDKDFRLDHSTSGQPTIYFNAGNTSFLRYNRANNGTTWKFIPKYIEEFGYGGGDLYMDPSMMVVSGGVFIRSASGSGLVVGSPVDPLTSNGYINCERLIVRDRAFGLTGHATTPRLYFGAEDTEGGTTTAFIGYNRSTKRLQLDAGGSQTWTEILGGLHVNHSSGGSGLKVGNPSDDFLGNGWINAENIACRDRYFRMAGHSNTPRIYFDSVDWESGGETEPYIGYNRSLNRFQIHCGSNLFWLDLMGGLNVHHSSGGSGIVVGQPVDSFLGDGWINAEYIASQDRGFRMEGHANTPRIYFDVADTMGEGGAPVAPPYIGYDRSLNRIQINPGDVRNWTDIIGGLHIFHGLGGSGLKVGNPTGDWKGEGAINAESIYDDNALVTCYAIEKAVTGKVDLLFWDSVSPNSKHEPAHKFAERGFDLDQRAYAAFWKTKQHLPALPSKDEWAKESLPVGDLVQRLIETVEVQAVHIDKLQGQIDTLRDEVEGLKNGTS